MSVRVVADPGFPRRGWGGVALTYYYSRFYPKNYMKWKQLERRRGQHPSAPSDPPMSSYI